MGRRLTHPAFAMVVGCWLTACANIASTGASPGGSGVLGDPCASNSDCASEYVCADGRCEACGCEHCTPGSLSCNGSDVVLCSSYGDTWIVQESCVAGCIEGACVDPVCAAGDQRCSNGDVEACLPDGSAWATVVQCPAGCDVSPSNPNAAACVENG